MKLPEAKSKPVFQLHQEKILLYGDWKTGKTSLVAAMPFDTLFIATEKGHSKVSAFVAQIETWADFQDVVTQLVSDTKFKMVCVDTIDMLWYLHLEHFKKAHNIDWEGDLKWGKGHALLVRGFVNEFQKLQLSNKGFFLLAHTASGNGDASMVEPNLPYDKNHQIRDAICGLCDYIWYLRMESTVVKGQVEQRRTLRTAPSEDYVAGARWPLPDPIPFINGDPAKSAQRIINAYMKSAEEATAKPKTAPKGETK
ncbi:MAG: AAA family ATPase [Aestuariibacter sp.]|nr:AAA family ATPase [Aestuariibacter sp.]